MKAVCQKNSSKEAFPGLWRAGNTVDRDVSKKKKRSGSWILSNGRRVTFHIFISCRFFGKNGRLLAFHSILDYSLRGYLLQIVS